MSDIDQIKITKHQTLKEALERLDESGKSILLLVNAEDVLKRTVTDGDIRRLLLSGHSLNDSLDCLDQAVPITIGVGASNGDVLNLMNEYEINQIPVVDDMNRPVDLHLRQYLQPRIQLSIPHMGDYERKYVEEAFETNWIAPLGPNVDAFEKEIADYIGSKYAAALSSGTASIHLALRLLGVGEDDIVLCSSFTFVASANPILYQGAIPIFVDSEPLTWNMSPLALEKALGYCVEINKKPKAIIVAHLYGQSADMDPIMRLSEKYDVPVIEDAAESLGAYYKGRHTGTIGKLGVFSFNGNKIITTSGGGMLVSDDGELIERARFLSTQARNPAPYYEHTEIGYNYRMSNVLAGIGRGQLKVLDSRVRRRREIFSKYRQALSDIEFFEWMPEPKDDYSNHWLSVLRINPDMSSLSPGVLIQKLADVNVEARHVWKPMHQQPLYKDYEYFVHDGGSCCDDLFETGICLPSASNMTNEQQDYVIEKIREIILHYV